MLPIDIKSTQVNSSNQYALGKRNRFPKNQKPEKQKVSYELDKIIAKWSAKSQIYLGIQADTPKKQSEVKRLFYIQQNYFVKNIKDIQATDLIEYSIDLKTGTYPVQKKILYYNTLEKVLANKIFFLMEDTSVIVRRSNEQDAKTKFPLKKKDCHFCA